MTSGPKARRGHGVQPLGRGQPQSSLLARAHGGVANEGSGYKRDPARERSNPCAACHRPPLSRALTATP
eukprot:2821975-Alexandrium_andersonii.AAC.1